MQTIANSLALGMTPANLAVLVDVREPAKFWEGHLPGAINLPSTRFNPVDYEALGPQPILLICNSGNRATQIATKLPLDTFPHVFLLEQQMDVLNAANASADTELCAAPDSGWSVDCQFRMTLGLLLLIFLVGYFLWSPFFLVIPLVLCTGLIITSIIDRCYLRMGIAMRPWNRIQAQRAEARSQESGGRRVHPTPNS